MKDPLASYFQELREVEVPPSVLRFSPESVVWRKVNSSVGAGLVAIAFVWLISTVGTPIDQRETRQVARAISDHLAVQVAEVGR